jgi:hypothetical protein
MLLRLQQPERFLVGFDQELSSERDGIESCSAPGDTEFSVANKRQIRETHERSM